jgi:hypothetical protein
VRIMIRSLPGVKLNMRAANHFFLQHWKTFNNGKKYQTGVSNEELVTVSLVKLIMCSTLQLHVLSRSFK